jgi:hypothetical protein
MLSRSLRSAIAGGALLAAAVVVAQPAFADTELGDSGDVGAHSLTDTHSTPGVRCDYHFNSGSGLGRLTSMTVKPPNMDLSPDKSHQTIGWSFSIQRRRQGEQDTVWKQVYKSPLQSTSIGGGDSGGFSSMSTDITVPANEGATGIHQYRVVVKMRWYGAAGVIGSSRHRADFYRGVMNTGQKWTTDGYCAGLSPS